MAKGAGRQSHVIARARDILTLAAGGAPLVLAEDAYDLWLQPDRVIVSIQAQPSRLERSRLVGERGGGGLRKARRIDIRLDPL